MSVFPAIFGLVACFLAYRYGEDRRARGLPVTLGHRVRVGLVVWGVGISALCLPPVLASAGAAPGPGDRLAVVSAVLAIGWAPSVAGLLAMLALRLVRRSGEPA